MLLKSYMAVLVLQSILYVIIGKIFIIYCGEIVEVRLIEVGGRVKIAFSFHSKMNLN